MYAMLTNKADKGITGNLHQVRLAFESTLSQLNHASQQLVFEGEIGNKLEAYLNAEDLYDIRQLGMQIESEMSLIHFTNPTLGVVFYYLADEDEIIFTNSQVKSDVHIFDLPLLAEQLSLSYYGPHTSINPLDGNKVLSVIRKVNIPSRDDTYLYMETDFKLTDQILNTDDIFRDTSYLFVDKEGRIAYSEQEDVFPVGAMISESMSTMSQYENFYLFEEISNQSWRIIAAIPKTSYNQEMNRWIVQFAFFAVLSILIGCLLAFVIWRMVYIPLLQLQRNIRRLKNGQRSELLSYERQPLVEFAEIHQEFTNMKQRIDDLIEDINRNAQSKRRLEIETLMYKINPHFIYNTLDTIRWQAKVNGHHETDRLVTTLNKLLYYNLGKGRTARIHDEIEALKNYVLLQGVRYNFHFDVRLEADPALLELPIPRFILQPLVENSISHGLKNKGGGKGLIEVSVLEKDPSHVMIVVSDNGYGMTEDEVNNMMAGDHGVFNITRLGIGWQYVRLMLELQYNGKAAMHVDSSPDTGTAITLTLPMDSEGAIAHVEGDDRR